MANCSEKTADMEINHPEIDALIAKINAELARVIPENHQEMIDLGYIKINLPVEDPDNHEPDADLSEQEN